MDQLARSMQKKMDDKANAIIKSYEKITGTTPKVQSTPGTPGQVLIKNSGEPYMRDEYRSMIGKLMFYTAKIAPECALSVGQLARHMQNPGEHHWSALDRAVGYIRRQARHTLIRRRP